MSEPKEPTVHARDSIKDSADSQAQPEISQEGVEAQQKEEQQLRQSKIKITLTENGREMQVTKIKSLQQRFIYMYNKGKPMPNLLSGRYHNQQRLYLMTCSMISLVMLEVFLQMSSVFMISYTKFQLQSKKHIEEWICVWRFLTLLYLEPQVDCKEGLKKEKRKIVQKQALSLSQVHQVSQVLSLLS